MEARGKIWVAVLVMGLMAMSLPAQQPFSGGLVAGASTGSVRISDLDSGFVNVITGRSIHGFAVGVYGKGEFGPFFVRPEVLYTFRGGQVEDDNAEASDFRLYKFEVPAMLGLKFLGPLFVEAGPVWNYVIMSTDEYAERDLELAKNGLGYRVGAGLQFDRVMFNLGYQGATYQAGNTGKTTFKEPYKLTFNIGLRLGG